MSLSSFHLLSRWPRRPSAGWIGIDIGSHSIKLAQVTVDGARNRTLHGEILPLPPDARLTAESLRTGWLTRLLREEMSHNQGFRGRLAACALSMSAMQFRLLSIPPGTPRERREMISQELLEGSTEQRGNLEFDYWDAPSFAGDENDATVNVLSLASDLATGLGEAVERSGLKCQVLDGAPFALARTTALTSRPAASEPWAILDWGHATAQLVVVVDGRPAFARMLKDCGVGGLVSATGNALGIPRPDCHELLSTVGLADARLEAGGQTDLQEIIGDAAVDSLNRLTSELTKTLAYLRLQKSELAPTSIVLVGGGAAIRHADARLSLDVGLPVSVWSIAQASMTRQPAPGLLALAAALSDLGVAA